MKQSILRNEDGEKIHIFYHIIIYIYIYIIVKTQNQLKLYKDGSVLENDQAGAGFIIPDFKTEKSFST